MAHDAPCNSPPPPMHHALAVFRCCSDGDTSSALAAATQWQQQQPCRLSSALLQWLTAQTQPPPAAPIDASRAAVPASDSTVYSSGASAFDLFASNGGNVPLYDGLCGHIAGV